MGYERRMLRAASENIMNTSALRSSSSFAPAHRAATGSAVSAADWLRATVRDFVGGLLAITKAGLLEQQTARPRLRRF